MVTQSLVVRISKCRRVTAQKYLHQCETGPFKFGISFCLTGLAGFSGKALYTVAGKAVDSIHARPSILTRV